MLKFLDKKKIAVIDLNTPFGHVNLINFYIKNLRSVISIVFLNKKIESFLEFKKFKCLFYSKNIFFSYFSIYHNLILNKITRVFFLSYSPIALFFFSFFILRKKIDIFLLEHDTLNKKKIIDFFFNKFLNKKIIRLVYNSNKKKFVLNNFSNKCKLIDHPINKDNKKSSTLFKERYTNALKTNKFFQNKKIVKILVPNRFYLDKEKFFNFYQKNPKCFFLILSKHIKSHKNIFKIENIKDYILTEIDYIYIAHRNDVYKNRIISWIYTSIAHNKKIILDYGYAYKYEKKRFPKFIFLPCKIGKNGPKKVLKHNKHVQFVSSYNKRCVKKLISILTGEM